MNDALKSLRQMNKANKLVRFAFKKFGPKSYKRGQGALLQALLDHDAATQRKLVDELGVSRGVLKDCVKKAVRRGYVVIGDAEAAKTYTVTLTDEGREVAVKRRKAHEKTAEEILSVLTPEEQAQLDALTGKLIVAMKDKGVSCKGKGRKVHRKGHFKKHGHAHGECTHVHHHHHA